MTGYRVVVSDDVDPALVGRDSVQYISVAQERGQALAVARLLLELAELPDERGPWRRARPGGQRTVSVEAVT